MNPTRRQFLKLSGAAAAATTGLPLFHFRIAEASQPAPKLASWEDLYRERWTWDSIVKGSHGWANCRSACAWDLYVKNGIVVREEQNAAYEASEPGVPDFNPRGCQKGACYTEVMYGPSRLSVPMKRVGERGSGQWQRISWDEAIDEIATKMLILAEEHGTDTIYQDLGPNFDHGATTVGRFKFQMKAGGMFADMWAEIGDLNIGATLTLGMAHIGGSSDEWFLSDFPVVWMMNPAVTQISDVHFLFEAQHNGSQLTVIDPQYSATAAHADLWLPIETGTDAALGLAVARHIWSSGNLDVEYVREQTDFPLLVRLDTGRFLRGTDLLPDAKQTGKEDLLFLWNPTIGRAEPAPGSPGADQGKLIVEGFTPPIEGTFLVALADGSEVAVSTAGSILREHLDPWTFAAAAEVTRLAPEVIKRFADGFANAERPMILSSWGSNRFLHSDLMNRTKLLCLAMKGAIGKRGAGYQATGMMGMAGFGSALQMNRTGILGRLDLMLGLMSPGELFDTAVDLVKRRRSYEDVIFEQATTGEDKSVCATNVSTLNYHHQGIAERLEMEIDGQYPRSLGAYVREAEEKGWQHKLPRSGQPRVYITGGSNLLRRGNQTQAMLQNMWPGIDLVVAIDQKMNFTVMNSDYILPAAGWYEKPGIKYAMSYIPYLHYCDVAVKPLGEAKDEWEIFWLLSKKIEEIAKLQNTPTFDGCGKFPVDWKRLHQDYSCQGEYGPKDAEKVTQHVIDNSPSVAGIRIEDLKKTGIEKFRNTGLNMSPSFMFNPDWKGEGVLSTLTHFTKYKWSWPTFSGRQQFYIDHPWFLEAGEAHPVHKASPKAGGDYPFRLVSCHSRWSIHSTWRDLPMLLRLQRGEPAIYLNEAEASDLGLADGEWAELYNDLDTMRMRIKYSTMVRPGVAYYFHGWDPSQFPEHKSYKWLIPGLMNPLHMAGGQGHLHFGINHLESGAFIRDTRVGIRPWARES
ncbi:MAG: molybdopterin-dependent oxidoreductase [Deltaproteobacteria bacterium]|nr:molybdopterin-dependent oxidoreductase [Deltaproteobacteria bacterium]MBW2392678.1 molybdopterin-dependent oxidoreductase [Deltaproteobacteria bacterium]